MGIQELVSLVRTAWHRKTPPRAGAKPVRHRAPARYTLEPIEPRLLLSATFNVDAAGVLTIAGDNAGNAISITQTDNTDAGLSVSVSVNGAVTALTKVTSVVLASGTGNDTVQLLTPINANVSLDGGGGSDTLQGPNADTAWTIGDAGSGTVADAAFSHFEVLRGGTGTDTFQMANTAAPGVSIFGGGGDDALLGANVAATWNIAAPNAGSLTVSGLVTAFSDIENLIGGNASDTFVMATGASITSIDGGSDDAQAATPAVDTLSYANRTAAVTVDLSGDTPIATDVGSFSNIDQIIGSKAATDVLVGYNASQVTWTLTGANTGTVGGTDVATVSFIGFENLTGVALTASDSFIFQADGSLSGTADGGSGTFDSLEVIDKTTGMTTVFDPATTVADPGGVDSSGTVTLSGRTINYRGIDHQDLTQGDGLNTVILGSALADNMVLEDADPNTTGQMRLRFVGQQFYDGTNFTQSIVFNDPADKLSIYGLEGADHIVVLSLDSAFSADIGIYGSRMPAVASAAPVPEEDPYVDTVEFSANIATQGGGLDIWADAIKVDAGVTIDTVGGDIVFRARNAGIAQLENLSPVAGTSRVVSIDIGAGANLTAGSIYLVAEADDKSIADIAGTPSEVDNYVISPLVDQLQSLLAMPLKLLVKNSTATINLGSNSSLFGTGIVGIYATAGADASGAASGSLFSIGYAQATADAEVTLNTGAVVVAQGAVVITSSGGATAAMSSSTEHDLESTPNPGKQQFAVAIGVSYANATSHVTLAKGSTVNAGTTANVIAGGTVSSDGEAESGLFADGKAGLSFGLSFSKADINTKVDGKITAFTGDGSPLKLEIDPLAKLNADGTPQLGYVDYAKDRIYVGPNGLATEDNVVYSNGGGGNIGGLVNGRTYYVIALGDGWISLSETAAQALRAGLGDPYMTGNIVDLRTDGLAPTTDNSKTFTSTDVNAVADTITLNRDPANLNTFSLGQPVVYHVGPGGPIAGLVDRNTYYVIASTDQNNLQGDSRLVDKQVIQLAETEAEARAGIAIPIGSATGGGYTLSAKHVFDSGMTNGISVSANLDAEDKASSSAGLTKADDPKDEKSLFEKGKEKVGTNVTDKVMQALTKSYRDDSAKPAVGASGSLSVAAALSFEYADHKVAAEVQSDAKLQSDRDIDVVATITEHTGISADSTTEPQKAPDDAPNSKSSAPNNVSVAVGVSVLNNSAHVDVDANASLDALLALRVISGISYPIGQRLDTYIPLSWSELTDSMRTDGYSAITKYLNNTLGAKDTFFNTWTSATSTADDIGVSGSVAVLVFNNDSQAVVHAGAKLNQNANWRNNATNPSPNQAANQPDGLGEQVVSVEATNYQQMINMAGVFQLPDLTVDPTDLEATRKSFTKNPFGANGTKGGAGGSILIGFQTNTTHATVEDGVAVYSGADGGFNVKAEEALLNVNLAQSAAKGGGFAVAGSVVYTGQRSDTLSVLGRQAIVTGRNARVYAGDLTTNADWAGGIAVGGGVGVGLSAAINDLQRATKAVIGDPTVVAAVPGAPESVQHINVSGDVAVNAKVDGQLWAFTVAGAVAKGSTGNSVPEDTSVNPISVLDEDVEPPEGGVAVAAAVSINLLSDDTQASIANAGMLRANAVSVTASDAFFQLSITGGASFATGGDGSNALAGAFSLNNLDVHTRALIIDTSITTTGGAVTVSATRSGDLGSLSAGGALATGPDSKASAGSVSVNVILNETVAALFGVVATTAGDVTVQASDSSRIIAVGGGVGISVGGKTGVGIGIAANLLGTPDRPTITQATVQDSNLAIGGPHFNVTATDQNPSTDGRIFAITAGVGVATGPDATAGVGAMMSINLTVDRTEATVKRTTVRPARPTTTVATVSAIDHSGIVAIGGAVGASTGNAIGAAIGYNQIADSTVAAIEDSNFAAKGAVTVQALSDSHIGGVVAGVAVSTGGGKVAGAGSILVNEITNVIDAHVSNSPANSTLGISTGGTLSVTAADNSLIASVAGGVSVSTNSTAVGAAISYNLIANRVTATDDRANLLAANIDIGASSNALLVAIAAGVAVSTSSAAVGGSLTVNSLSNTVNAHVADAISVTTTSGDLRVTAAETDRLIVVAGGVAVSTSSVGVGAAIAYNFIGGSFDSANPDVVHRDSDATDQIAAYISNTGVQTGGNVEVRAGYLPPLSSEPTSIDIGGGQIPGLSAVPLPQPSSVKGAGSQIVSVTLGVGVANQAGVGGSVSVNYIAHDIAAYIADNATDRTVNAKGSVLVQAADNLQAADAAGGVGLGQNGIGAAISLQIDKSQVDAHIAAGSSVSADGTKSVTDFDGARDVAGNRTTQTVSGVSVSATSFEDLITVGVGLAGGARFGVNGSGSVTVLDRSTQAYIGAAANINTKGQLNLLASDTTSLVGVSGGVAAGGLGGIGAGVDVASIGKNTQAYLDSGTTSATAPNISTGGGVTIVAQSAQNLSSVAAQVSAGGTAGVGGAVGVYTIDDVTHAYIGNFTNITANGSVVVSAYDNNRLTMVDGTIAGGGSAGIGAAAGAVVVNKDTQAYIGSGAFIISRGTATSPGTVIQNGDFSAIGGYVDPSTTTVNAAADTIAFSTPDRFQTGQAVVYSNGGGTDIAGLKDGTTYYVVVVDATHVKLAATQAAALGGGPVINIALTGTTGHQHSLLLPGSVALPSTDNNSDLSQGSTGRLPAILARRDVAPTTAAFNGIAVTALNQDSIESYAVGGAGAGGVAVQVAGAVAVLNATTKAYVGPNAQVYATGPTGPAGTLAPSVKVIASDNLFDVGVAGAAAIAGAVAVTPGLDVTIVNRNTSAVVLDGAAIVATGDLNVLAQAEQNLLSIALGIAGSGTVSVSGAVSALSLNNQTTASIGSYLGQGATASTGGNVSVVARDTTANGMVDGAAAIGIAGGGIGVSVGASSITKDTEAFLGRNSLVNANGLTPAATLSAPDGTGAITATGFAASKTFSGVKVAAESSENVFTVAVAGAGGFVGGIAGAVSTTLITSATHAYAQLGTQINQNTPNAAATQSVFVTATNVATVFGADGSIAGGVLVGGLAGGVDVGIVRNTTLAEVGPAKISAAKDIEVDALARRRVDSYAISAAAGSVGIAGAVSVYSIGAPLGSDGTTSLTSNDGSGKSTGSFVDDQMGIGTPTANGATPTAGSQFSDLLVSFTGSSSSDRDGTQVLGSTTKDVLQQFSKASPTGQASAAINSQAVLGGTTARIGSQSTIVAGGDVNVDARERLDLYQTVGAGAVGGTVGFGGAVAVATVNSSVTAIIDGGTSTVVPTTTVQAGGTVRVQEQRDLNDTGRAYTGAAGLVGIGAQVLHLNDTSVELANVTGNATIAQAGAVQIQAASNRTLDDQALGVTLGAIALTGSEVKISATGSTSALLDGGASVGQDPTRVVGSLAVLADVSNYVVNQAQAVTIALAGGNGAFAAVTLAPTVVAAISGSKAKVRDDLQLRANLAQVIKDRTVGISGGLLTVGINVTAVTLTPTVTAEVRSGATAQAGRDVTLLAQSNTSVSDASNASGAALFSGIGASASMSALEAINANVGGVVIAGRDVSMHAESNLLPTVTSSNQSFAVFSVGDVQSSAAIVSKVTTQVGAGAAVFAVRDVALTAVESTNYTDATVPVGTAGTISATTATSLRSASTGWGINRQAFVTIGQGASVRAQRDLSLTATELDRTSLTANTGVASQLSAQTTASAGITTDQNAVLSADGTLSFNANATNTVGVTTSGPVTPTYGATVTTGITTSTGTQLVAGALNVTSAATYGNPSSPSQSRSTINLNGDIYAAGTQDRLLIVNGDGGIDPHSNLPATVTATDVVVADTAIKPLVIKLSNASSIFTTATNTGTAVIHNNSAVGKLTITNNSNRNLTIGALSTAVAQTAPKVTLNGVVNTTLFGVVTAPASGVATITTNGTGSLTLSKNITVLGSLALTTTDKASAGQDITVKTTAQITANTIVVHAGDNITMEAGSALIATAGTLELDGDFGNADAGVGSLMALSDGVLSATGTVTINGGTDGDRITTGVGLKSLDTSGNGIITLFGSDGNDIIDVRGFATGTLLQVIGGAGDDVTLLGDIVDPLAGTRRLASITNTVLVNGGAGSDTLNMFDTGDALATSGTLSAGGLTGAGLGSGGKVLFGDAIETVQLALGSAADSLQVTGTKAGTSTTINLGAGRDIVTVGSTVLGGGGDTGGILGALTLFDASGTAQLIVEDSGALAAQATTIDATTITGAGLGAVLTYRSSNVSKIDLLVNLGNFADTVTVLNTAFGIQQIYGNGGNDSFALRAVATGANPSFFGGDGNDTLTIGSSAGIVPDGFVTYDGGTGSDALLIDDSGATNVVNAHITASRVDIAALTANYTTVESLTVQTGQNTDSVWIASTSAATTVRTGPGNDFVYAGSFGSAPGNNGRLSNLAGALTVDGGTGTDTLYADDTADPVAVSGILTPTQLQGLGMPSPMNYVGFETVKVNLGPGGSLTTTGPSVGNAVVDRPLTDTASGSIFVLNDPFATTATGTLSSWQFFRDNALSSPAQITPLLLSLGTDGRWTVVAVGTTRSVGTTGVQAFDFGLVSGNAKVAGLYFGWKDGSAAGANNAGVPEWTDNTTGPGVVWLGAGKGAVAVSNSYAPAGTFARTYSMQAYSTPATTASPRPKINGAAGNDVVSIDSLTGSTAARGNGNLNSISSALTIDRGTGTGTGTDSVTLDDSSDALADTGNLTRTKLRAPARELDDWTRTFSTSAWTASDAQKRAHWLKDALGGSSIYGSLAGIDVDLRVVA